MSHSITVYLSSPLPLLEALVENHQKEFDSFLEETFSEEELLVFEKQIDAIAAVYVQPLLSELSFDDFYADPKQEDLQKKFFNTCKSSILFENLPFLENNPFQVAYLAGLIEKFDEALIDKGGVNELLFKEPFLEELKKHKRIDVYIPRPKASVKPLPGNPPVDPIDFLVQDVYKELDRLKDCDLDPGELPQKFQKIYQVMKSERLDSHSLFSITGLNAKDFDDGLEKVKFWLRRH